VTGERSPTEPGRLAGTSGPAASPEAVSGRYGAVHGRFRARLAYRDGREAGRLPKDSASPGRLALGTR